MRLIFHGGAQEVGRSCVELRTNGERYLLDCGLKFHEGGMDYPAKVFDTRTFDGLFLSHAHLDHSGGLPFFKHYRMTCPIFCNQETQDITKTLLEDSHRIAQLKHMCEAFTDMDLKAVYADMRNIPYNVDRQHKSISYAFYNAGHVPGSVCIRIKVEGMSLLYTGDYNTQETELMAPADPHAWGPVDVLISESTYGDKAHEQRDSIAENFLDSVQRAVARGGRVLIPVFALGRAQEILLLLAKREWSVPIFMDGMAKKITNEIIRGDSPYVLRRKTLQRMHDSIHLVKGQRMREEAADEPGIYIATSGMLQGGPAESYLERLWNDPKSAIFLSGFQVERTRGWYLSQQGTIKLDGEIKKVACEVARFDFSAHLSRPEIEQTILATKPKVVIFMHGDPVAIAALAAWAKESTGSAVYAPRVGEQIDIGPGGASVLQLYTADDGYAFPEEHQHGERCRPAYDDYPKD